MLHITGHSRGAGRGKRRQVAMPGISGHMEAFRSFLGKASPTLFAVFRAGIGLFFMKHGLAKLGVLGPAQPFLSLLWFAGIIETAVGLSLVFGILYEVFALIGAATMVVAYVLVHLPRGWEGLESGELAILYFLAFIGILSHGKRK